MMRSQAFHASAALFTMRALNLDLPARFGVRCQLSVVNTVVRLSYAAAFGDEADVVECNAIGLESRAAACDKHLREQHSS